MHDIREARDIRDACLVVLDGEQQERQRCLRSELVKAWLRAKDDATLARCRRQFIAQMNKPDAARLLNLLAALSHQTALSLGCYCADPARCHRTVLRDLLIQRGANIE